VRVQAGYDVELMHGGDASMQSSLSEPLHVAIAGRDVPDYDIIELLIDAGLSLECTVGLSVLLWHMPMNSVD